MSELLLAIDAATSHGGVAIGRGGVAIAEVSLGDTRRHSELLLPAVEFVLQAAAAKRSDVSAIVVGAGPGSFTGVRIAAATARGLAAALDIPLLAYSSLAALAAGAGGGAAPVCAMFDAKRGEVYAACYRFTEDTIDTLLAPMAAPIADVMFEIELVRALTQANVKYVGEGALLYARETGVDTCSAPVTPRAGALLWLAHHDRAAGTVADTTAFEPTYVRASAAERKSL